MDRVLAALTVAAFLTLALGSHLRDRLSTLSLTPGARRILLTAVWDIPVAFAIRRGVPGRGFGGVRVEGDRAGSRGVGWTGWMATQVFDQAQRQGRSALSSRCHPYSSLHR